MAVSVTISVTDDKIPTGTPLSEVTVHVYTEDGVTFVADGLTDVNGEVVFLLDDQVSFWVRFLKWEYGFDTKLLISVEGPGTYDVVGRDLVGHPPSTVPELCRASGVVVNAAGQPRGGATFRFNATCLPDVVAGRAVVAASVTVFSGEWGYVEVELIRGGVYDVVVSGHEDTPYRVKVPDSPAVNITDLIWPYVVSLTYNVSDPVLLDVGDSVEVRPVVTLSSGVQTPYELDEDEFVKFGYYITLTEDNPDSAISKSWDSVLDTYVIYGVGTGTANLVPTLVPGRTARRLPEPVRDLQSLTILVS